MKVIKLCFMDGGSEYNLETQDSIRRSTCGLRYPFTLPHLNTPPSLVLQS